MRDDGKMKTNEELTEELGTLRNRINITVTQVNRLVKRMNGIEKNSAESIKKVEEMKKKVEKILNPKTILISFDNGWVLSIKVGELIELTKPEVTKYSPAEEKEIPVSFLGRIDSLKVLEGD